MFEGLQENAGRYSSTSTPVRPTQIILDGDYTKKAIEMVKGAQSEIRLCAYAWRWYDSEPGTGIQQLNLELLRAIGRGLQVRCLVDTEVVADTFRRIGFDTRSVVPTRMLHTKALAIDRKTLVIGSHNLTKRANSDNYECSMVTQEVEPVLQFIEYFDRMWLSRG